MAGAARYADGPSVSQGLARGLDRILKAGVHHRGCTGAQLLHGGGAGALRVDFVRHGPQQILQPSNDGWIVIADLKQHFGATRNDARRARIERDAAGGPDRARSAGGRETLVDCDTEFGQSEPRIFSRGHAGRAGVVLLPDKIDLVLPDADDGGHDADREVAAFERVSLLDMRLQISDVPSRLSSDARASGEPYIGERLAHGAAAGAVARGIDVGLGHLPDIRAGAEKMAKVSFLVAPSSDFDGAIQRRIGIEDPRGLDRVDVADAVDRGGEAGCRQVLQEQVQSPLVRLTEGRLVNASFVGADGAKRIEI